MTENLKIGVTGAAGRMGRMVVAAVHDDSGCTLVGAAEAPRSDALGQDAGLAAGLAQAGIAITDDASSVFAAADAVIDFTAPAATRTHAGLAAETGTSFVCGTTGLDEEDRNAIAAAARVVPVLWAPNMSMGVNLLLGLVKSAAAALPAADIEIVESHHRYKVDAPSGTALALGRAAAAGRGVRLEDVQKLSREGITGERPAGEIGFATLRGGDIAGEHTVMLSMDGERIELTHRATNRLI
ncbi:MAG: 4-hydroxy-tetrahydrodipicolinate reductase, partial [Alphaproteobacteria bacterium]|nr:4-hydroxy-tetrahydrodipicolinate reductase [Alphaproteobacteria bacterium]